MLQGAPNSLNIPKMLQICSKVAPKSLKNSIKSSKALRNLTIHCSKIRFINSILSQTSSKNVRNCSKFSEKAPNSLEISTKFPNKLQNPPKCSKFPKNLKKFSRVTGVDVPMPYTQTLEAAALPTAEHVVKAVKKSLNIA